MGHHISAIIGKLPITENKIYQYGLAVAYEAGYAIIILDQDSIYYWSAELDLGLDSKTEDLDWDCETTHHFATEVGLNQFAIIQTDYFAGMGDQYAVCYDNGLNTMDGNINQILNKIGVVSKSGMDEFDSINLGKYRYSECYYWDTHNQAVGKANMIPGKFFKTKN